jgi:hypothetical protein
MTDNPPCGERTDFYTVYNNDGGHCFANDGELGVYITNVTAVSPGNNKGQVITIDGSGHRCAGRGGDPTNSTFR